jgi:hypothetical protein
VVAASGRWVSASGATAVASEIEGAASALASEPVHLQWLEELVRQREAGPNVASEGLFMEWHLPLAILLHFLDFVFNNNGLVDHVLEVYVVCVEQLELNVIIQSIQEHVLLLFNGVDVFSSIS